MRTSTILTAALVGGALATPVKKWLEERALVVNYVTITTVVWVTAGQATQPTVAPKVAVAAPHRSHGHYHKAAQPAPKPEEPTTTAPPPPPPPPPASSTPAPAPVKEPETTSTPPAPVASPNTNSGSTQAPTNYPSNLDTTSEVYKALALQHHNIHRANHSADALEWDDTLASYAEQTAKTCVWGHDLSPGGGGYGQNIAAGTPAGEIAKVLTGGFYNDEAMLYPGYGNDNPDMAKFEKWGHFTQMLWQTTKKVGCYTYTCSPPGAMPLDCNPSTGQSYLKNTGCGNGGMYAVFTVCNYSPPGNYAGQYSKVGKPLNKGVVLCGKDGVTGL
ncbi:MAG: hypothetical protein Q9207_007129 [Kuettlingeria erythrocarpa]